MTEYDDNFEAFWLLYPERWIKDSDRHVKIGKAKAWERWRFMRKTNQQHAMAVLPVFKRTVDARYIPDAWRWLRDKKYEDYDLDKSKAGPSRKPKCAFCGGDAIGWFGACWYCDKAKCQKIVKG